MFDRLDGPRWMPLHSPRQLVHAKRPGSGWTLQKPRSRLPCLHGRCYFKMPNWRSKMLFHADETFYVLKVQNFLVKHHEFGETFPKLQHITYIIMGKNMVIQESSIFYLLLFPTHMWIAGETAWSFNGASEASKVTRGEPKEGRQIGQKWCANKGSFQQIWIYIKYTIKWSNCIVQCFFVMLKF